MLFLAKTLSFYKRKDIQEELVRQAKDKEVAFRFDELFGKRPEVLTYPNDVLELAKQRVTSFHCSEELWKNPLQLSPGMKREELDSLRKGWDLVFDIDCPVWELSKITTSLIVRALKDHNINSVYVKFSGNKGFHVALPFEIFPEKIGETYIKDKFPDFATRAMLYLLDFISKKYIKVDSAMVTFGDSPPYALEELRKLLKKDNTDDLTYWYCESCKKRVNPELAHGEELVIGSDDVDFLQTSSIGRLEKTPFKFQTTKGRICNCKEPRRRKFFDPLSILNIDAILISSRHLYRMPYSLHEKSQLVSIPIDPEKVLKFDKEEAKPENVVIKYPFLDRQPKTTEAAFLWQAIFDFKLDEFNIPDLKKEEFEKKFESSSKVYSLPEKAIGEENFPPCIKLILNGIEDGRKRSCFVLVNFLASCGWSYELIEKRLLEWNEKNVEPLRPQYVLGQIRYAKQSKKILPPPSCNNLSYYKSFSVCKPDELCRQIKNPLQYAKRKERSKNIYSAKKKKSSKD